MPSATVPTSSRSRVRPSGLTVTDPFRVARRLRVVSVLLGLVFFATHLSTLFISGDFLLEFKNIGEWGPPLAVDVASVAVFILAGPRRMSPAALINVGLVYQVVVSFGIAGAQYFQAFAYSPAELVNRDTVGVSMVAVWILAFAVLVPTRSTKSVLALMASAASVPLIYWLSVRAGQAPAIARTEFFLTFVQPYLVVAIAALIVTRIVYGLGVAVREAQELGSYRLEALLGTGGMGEVWRASHRMLARPAAVKLIRRETLGEGHRPPDDIVARFTREAQVTASLQSPHTVDLYDFGTTDDGTLYYVMELLDGVDLESLVESSGPLPPERVIYLMRQICASLSEAHRSGLVHRDVKPSNILVCRYALDHDVVKVLDFGLVKHHASNDDSGQFGLTQGHAIAGTPAFMAPEMIVGDLPIDGRADLYGVGCVGYWLLTGTTVFRKPSPMAVMAAHVNDPPDPPSARTDQPIPPALEAVILGCLAKTPDDRPATAEDLARQLAEIRTENEWTAARAAAWWEATGRQGTEGVERR